MGKYIDKFKNKVEHSMNTGNIIDGNDFDSANIDQSSSYNDFDDVGIRPSQKPESFYHYILENQYKDLERSIRGFKDVFDKSTNQWKTKRKSVHCFTDEEAEEILRTAQSHLATDIKLGYISIDAFPLMMNAIYEELSFLFESFAEYRYGRYGSYDLQYEMKLQNHKIFLELFTRVQANYSRSIKGQENKYTHDSVKGQESLQQTERDYSQGDSYT